MHQPAMRRRGAGRGFTLIELLIVIAIISILALIAVPNFLEAQTRAKVSRTLADMRAVATALEAYAVDWGSYPRGRPEGKSMPNYRPVSRRMVPITTPVGYITQLPADPFPALSGNNGDYALREIDTYDYYDTMSDEEEDGRKPNSTRGAVWRLAGAGPDLWASFGMYYVTPGSRGRHGVDYDPTNGTLSNGDIVRLSAVFMEYLNEQ